MKITIYELLGMIKDGNAPAIIKYKGIIFEYELQVGYINREDISRDYFVSNFNADSKKDLNDEVEIIEEDKKIEKIKNYIANVGRVDDGNIEAYIRILFKQQTEIIYKLDEIIDKINKEEQ